MDSAQGGFVFPKDATVPDVAFAVGDNVFQINAADFAYGLPDSKGMLFGGIQNRGSNPFDILGDGKLFSLMRYRLDRWVHKSMLTLGWF